jgi:hypothetical protein
MDSRFLISAFAGALALATAGCVADTGPTTAPAGATIQTERAVPPGVGFRGRCGLINIGTAQNPRFVHDPACGSGASD